MHGRRIPSVLLPAVLATAGCAPSLEIGRPVAPLPARFEAMAPDPAPEPAALDRWWTLFGDAQLDDLVARGLRANADVRLGLARLREAQAIRRAALAPFRVQGDLQVTGGVQRSESLSGPDVLIGGPGGTSVTSGATVAAASPTFNLSWELDLLGRRGVARAAADADLAAARFVQEGTRAKLAADMADALFAARGLAAQAEAARETLAIQQGILAAMRTRTERGLAANADVARIDADVAQAEAQAAQLEAELAATKRAILVLLGEADKPLDTLPIHP
ncbi:TolC family protein, partial [Sphingomonas sp. CBMAI 2297]